MSVKIKQHIVIQAFTLIAFFVALSCAPSSGNSDRSTRALTIDRNGIFYKTVILKSKNNTTDQSYSRGRQLFTHYCQVCHGEKADGQGFNAFTLKNNFNATPFDFTDKKATKSLTPDEMRNVITQGGAAVGKSPYMPPWGHTLSAYQIQAIIDYLWIDVMRK